MFGRIAPRYDLLNHLLSFNIDRLWRRRLIRRIRPILDNPSARVLDLCCGTGDVMAAMKNARARIYGSDFAHPMLTEANRKSNGRWRLFEADGLVLPVSDQSLDLVTIAFGFRNFANYRGGLLELRRAIRSGGTLAILEFSPPPKTLFGRLHNFYSRTVLPKIGGLISGSPEAYQYLPSSVENFPEPADLAGLLRESGFRDVRYERMTGGTVALHIAS